MVPIALRFLSCYPTWFFVWLNGDIENMLCGGGLLKKLKLQRGGRLWLSLFDKHHYLVDVCYRRRLRGRRPKGEKKVTRCYQGKMPIDSAAFYCSSDVF
jgi:hypothetical protein